MSNIAFLSINIEARVHWIPCLNVYFQANTDIFLEKCRKMEVKAFGKVQKGYFTKSQNDKTGLTFSVYLRDNDYLCNRIIKI